MNLTYEFELPRLTAFAATIDPRVVERPVQHRRRQQPARSYPQVVTAPDWPYLNRIAGDPRYKVDVFSFNGGYDDSGPLEFYTFGSYGFKIGEAHENYPRDRQGGRRRGQPPDVPFPARLRSPPGIDQRQDYAIPLGANGDFGGCIWDFGYDLWRGQGQESPCSTPQNAYASVLRHGRRPPTAGFHAGDFYAGAVDHPISTT